MDALADSAVKRLQAGYQQLFEHYPLPMLVVNLATLRLMAANEAAARCYGYSVAQLTDMHLPDLYFNEDQASVSAYMALSPRVHDRQRRCRHKGQGGRAIDVDLDFDDMCLHGLSTRMVLVSDVTQECADQRAQAVADSRPLGAVQRIAEGFFALDTDARFVSVNQQAEELLKVKRHCLLGKTLWDRCPLADTADNRTLFEAVAQRREAISFEFFFAVQQVWFEVRAFANAQGVSVFFRDVTAQHKNNERLDQERERLDAIVKASSEAIITMDAAGCVQTINPGAERVFGISSASIMGKSIHTLVPEQLLQSRSQSQSQPVHPMASTDSGPRTMGLSRFKGVGANGCEIDLEGSVAQVTIGHEKMFIATLRDVTTREQADAERQHARAQLSHLAHRLMLQEKELVKRMAQALHDQLGQTTAAIRIVHETMGVLRRGKESREYLRLDQQLGKLIDQANRQVRMVLGDLLPPLLDEQGLAAALDNELRSRALRHKGMNFVLHVPPHAGELRWPSAVEYGAFMIAREAIENALRHADATQVMVNLVGGSDQLALDVIDNGLGFQTGALAKSGHLGITGMLERAHSIGSSVTVSPGDVGGTRVSLRWKVAA